MFFIDLKMKDMQKSTDGIDLLTFLLVICVFWCHLSIYSLTEKKMGCGEIVSISIIIITSKEEYKIRDK